jgi:uncharacterized protein (TIGR03083 family)
VRGESQPTGVDAPLHRIQGSDADPDRPAIRPRLRSVVVDWIAHVEADGRALLEAARGEPSAAVPACDGWTLTELAAHTALIHQRTAYLCRTGARERPSQKGGQIEPPPADGVLDWAAGWHAELVDRLRTTPADTEVWSFFPGGRTVGWWARRMAHETLVHRVDAEQAVGRQGDVDPDVAVDGVEEVLDVFVARFGTPPFGTGQTVHLHATDVTGEWLVTLGADAVSVERGHAKGDAAVRGAAAVLYLWLWGRAPLGGLEVLGDASLPETLRTIVSTSTA